jgi:8-oxo-dGTP pyrophosphatase MutT (NUDIX family)
MKVISEEYISQRLAASMESQNDTPGYAPFLVNEPRPASVLIPLFYLNNEDRQKHFWQVLLTRRTNSVPEHQGQVAFPGGSADLVDTSPESTALRESREEIGLDPSQVKILGRMNQIPTISNYCVTPVVGVIPWPFPIQIEEVEVSRVFHIPLDWLADPIHHEIRYRSVPPPYSDILKETKHPVIYFQPYDGELLWGVSAQITLNFITLLYGNLTKVPG